MISSWDVYVVMQLDSIRMAVGGLAILLAIAAGVATLVSFAEELPKAAWRSTAIFCSLALFFVSTFLPSSKTAAAMILVPALTSDQVMEPVTAEARELYALAKQALQNVAQPKPEAPAAEKK